MDKWLAGLIVVAVGLPLIMFFGNLNVEVSEAEAVEHATAVGAEAAENDTSIVTPEIYLGYSLARSNIGNDEGLQPETAVSYTAPASYSALAPDIVYVGGIWKSNADSLELVSGEGRVVLKYTARTVDIVADSVQQPSLLQVILEGNFVNSTNSGSDVKKAEATVSGQRPYNLVSDKNSRGQRIIELNIKGEGFRLYTFTFG